MYSLCLQNDIVTGVPTENLLSTILEALAEPTVSYIGLGYDTTASLSTGESYMASMEVHVRMYTLHMLGPVLYTLVHL